MDDRKKIVLATEDILAKNLEDIFINVNLQQKFNQIRKEKFDNNFDLAEQFRKERNASRSFRVYGIIDSTIVDCDNLSLKVYSESNMVGGVQVLTNLIASKTSTPLGYGDKNVFGRMRGKYIIELDNYETSSTIYIKILGNGINYADTIIEQKLVFYGADGNFIEYGTDTVDISIDGEFLTLNNDFPFFYNKHWIKNNFQIEEVKIRNASFEKSFYSFEEGNSGTILVSLNNTSVFGNESIEVTLTTPALESYGNAAPNIDFTAGNAPFSFPINLTWSVGEKDKEIDIAALGDFVIENINETFSIALSNPVNLTTNSGIINIESTTIQIVDKTVKKYVNYNFQKMIRNIAPVTNPSTFFDNLGQFPGFLMNIYGAQTGVGSPLTVNSNYRFFPNDTFELEITNRGDNTTLPVIPGFTTNEQFFEANQTIAISVINKYQNHDSLPLEKALFDFVNKSFTFAFPSSPTVYKDFPYINGIKLGFDYLVADNFISQINSKYSALGIDMPFTISQDDEQVTLTATHPANNINGFIPQKPAIFGLGEYALIGNSEVPSYPSGRVTSITPQIPFELKLYANSNDATTCSYEFSIKKKGYKTVLIPSQSITATVSAANAYLVTPIRDVVGPTVPSGDPDACNTFSYAFNIDGYYLNGVALIAADAQAKNELIPAFNPQFRTTQLSSELIICNNLIGFSKVLS